MKIAVEGCCHDELEVIYDTLEFIQQTKDIKIDLLLICGDFEATRNPDDLLCMAVPLKYRDMKYFYKYYKGEKKAPMLTVIIGGNHEASNYMQELPYGGWLAPNIYYLGYAGIINVGGLRIGGLSGIYKGADYHKGHFEKPPYSNDTMRSCYHIRSLEIFRFKQVSKPVNIMLSHDWPLHAVHAGNTEQLMRWKPHFKDEILQNCLGSPAAQEVLTHIKPAYWFSAHLHCKYAAVIDHQCEGDKKQVTKFLALDKCLPKRNFLQVLDVPSTQEPPFKLELDPEWLVILKNTNHLLNITSTVRYMPGVGCKERYDFKVTDEEIKGVLEDFGGDMTLPENFEMTVTPYDGSSDKRKGRHPTCKVNPQTTLLCQMLGITDPFAVFCGQSVEENPDEISLDIESETSETTQDTSEPEDGTTTAESDIEPTGAETSFTGNTTLDSTGEQFPTFIHSHSNESLLNDSSISEVHHSTSTPNRPSTTPAARENLITDDSADLSITKLVPLSLPAPKIDLVDETCEPSELVAATRKRESPESNTVSDSSAAKGDDASSNMASANKKFKRRNVAMYSILTSQETEGGNSESEPT